MVDPLGLAPKISEPGVKYGVGPYNEMKGTLAGHDAHHVGQKALMKQFVPDYDPETAPTILVPKTGHTIRGPQGIVSRSTKGVSSAQDLLGRDLDQLRQAYPDLSDEQLQKLVQMNQQMYPGHF